MNKANATDTCLTGKCPTPAEPNMHTIKLSEGSGGKEMQNLIDDVRKRFPPVTTWQNTTDDGATTMVGDKRIVFTSDSYVVTPIFFPGGNIGKIAFCGTVNDLSVMGARPIGISLSLVLEEGFSKDDLFRIIDSIAEMSKMARHCLQSASSLRQPSRPIASLSTKKCSPFSRTSNKQKTLRVAESQQSPTSSSPNIQLA